MSIDVLMPARNAAWCIADAIDGICNQTIKPDNVLVGIDDCHETAETALDIGGMDVYYFPNQVGPYRIRNTLALLSQSDIVTTFDADDLMHSDHIEMMTKALNASRFSKANALITQDDSEPVPWTRAHGVIAIHRDSFIEQGGFEPWRAGADTEAIYRWQACGMQMICSKTPTMTVRKHSGGLTSDADAGYGSRLRNEYRTEIHRRMFEPVRLNAIATAYYEKIDSMDQIEDVRRRYAMAETRNTTDIEIRREYAVTKGDVRLVEDILKAWSPGCERKDKRLYKRARRWVASNLEGVE